MGSGIWLGVLSSQLLQLSAFNTMVPARSVSSVRAEAHLHKAAQAKNSLHHQKASDWLIQSSEISSLHVVIARALPRLLLGWLPLSAVWGGSSTKAEAVTATGMVVECSATTASAYLAAERLMGRVEAVDEISKEAAEVMKRARIAESDNDFEKALRLYDRLTRIAPGYAYSWSNKGNAYVALGELDNALDSYARATELLTTTAGDTWLVYLNKATTELALNKLPESLTDLEKARRLHGQPDVLLFANKGIAMERQGDYAGALESYENAVLTKPKEVSPWWLRYSLVLFQEKQDIKSMEIMRKVAAKYQKVDEIKAALSTLVFAFGDVSEAESIWSGMDIQAQLKYRDKAFLVEVRDIFVYDPFTRCKP